MEFTKQEIEDAVTNMFANNLSEMDQERSYTIRTGAGGMEMIQICMEEEGGLKRVYLKKVIRIIRNLGGIKKDRGNREYKLVRK